MLTHTLTTDTYSHTPSLSPSLSLPPSHFSVLQLARLELSHEKRILEEILLLEAKRQTDAKDLLGESGVWCGAG